MKVSLNWLRELIELPATVDSLVDLLTLAGVEVEGIETLGVSIPNVVVAQIRESVQHPNADRLSVCQVDDGSGSLRQIVCGAKNYKVGDKVPVALPGAVLPGDFKIKVGKLRGVESQGMLCSPDELGLPKGEDGLLILGPDPVPGTPLSQLFPGDTILELEITPNRPDLLSFNGIAREIGALTAKAARMTGPGVKPIAPGESTIRIGPPELCPLYIARIIRGVKVGPSPAWLRTKLESLGLRPINNIVDISNLVMLELGQPLHAFDLGRMRGPVQVRMATAGEQFVALDRKSYTLAPEHLVIADDSNALALAGIMGGLESAVTESTTDILLESAAFEPKNIRRTSRQVGLSSDSSYRFERGVDRAAVLLASQRATELIVELAGGQPSPMEAGFAADASQHKPIPTPVTLRPARVAEILGVEVAASQIDQILTGFGLIKAGDGWEVPSFRADLTREIDLIEEVARVTGMERIPARTQARFAAASATDAQYDFCMELRRACVAHGLHEARSLTLVPAQPMGLELLQFDPAHLLRVKNPMIDDQVVLRPHLLHGLLKAVRDNVRAGAGSIGLFEIGRVFSQQQPEEFTHLGIVLSGPRHARSWRTGEEIAADFFDLKGLVAAILGNETTFEANANEAAALSLSIKVAGRLVGFLGQLAPAAARALDATAPVLFAEIDLGEMPVRKQPSFREIDRFPIVTRDIALLAPLDLAHARIEALLRSANETLLVDVELFDLFTDPTGVKLPADHKSLAYSLTYRSSEKTLTTEEVNAAHGRLKAHLKAGLPVAFRE